MTAALPPMGISPDGLAAAVSPFAVTDASKLARKPSGGVSVTA